METSAYLVNVHWLAEHLNDPNLVIIDTRFSLPQPNWGSKQYNEGHIPGAYYLDLNQDLSSPVQPHGGRHPLPNWDTFTAKLNRLGIYSSSPTGPTRVVIYDNSRFAFAARLWWMLRYLGHKTVSILDGSIQAWNAAGLPLSQAIPPERAGRFEPVPQPDWVVDIETLKARKDLPEVTVIDSRSRDRWCGEVEPIDPIAGSIPGSINSFWQNVSTDAGELKNSEVLVDYWSSIGLQLETIVYCGSGVTACVNLFSLVMAGHPMPKLYPGGWSDWCSYLRGNTDDAD